MKSAFTILLCLVFSLLVRSQQAHFLSNPALTPDGHFVIFSFEGDLWRVSSDGGRALRLTAMQGYETSPRVSPDGNWIAFTGRQYGNGDIYILPSQGGEIKQITHHSGNDEVSSWSWDSKHIYFNSSREGQVAGYKVSMQGETARRVLGDYFFQYDHNLVEHPTSGEIFFNNTWESSNQVARKRYKGPFNPDIQSYNLKTGKHKQYTSWEGKDFGATIDKQGNIYFISDELNGEYNLYELDHGRKKALTRFNSSIKLPQVNAGGTKIVFEREYQLWMYDIASSTSKKINIDIVRNNVLPKEKDYDIKGNISAFDLSPDGKKMATVSRGELFVSDAEGKFIQQIDRKSNERVVEVYWQSDNKTLIYSQTSDGYTNWYSILANGTGNPRTITADKKNNRQMVLNKKRTKAVYVSGRDELKLINLDSAYAVKTIAIDEFWGFQGSDPGFSPNDEYVLYTARRDFEHDIFIYNIKENKSVNLTETSISEVSPIWAPDGKSIFFSSQRLKPLYPFGLPDAKVYQMTLDKAEEPYRSDKFSELFKEEKKDTSKKAANKDSIVPISIDMDLLMERLNQISPDLGAQFLTAVFQKNDKTTVLYVSNHDEGRNALWKSVIEPFEEKKTEKITGTDGLNISRIREAADKYYLLANGTVHKLNLDGNKIEPINMTFKFRRNLSEEFHQMFFEAWAQMEQNYYDDKFHGLDWNKTKLHYQQFLPHINNRADFRTLLNDMLGELNSSHQGFGTFGEDEQVRLTNQTMETGILFDINDPYKVKSILKRSPADRKAISLAAGDRLVKVNGETIDPAKDRDLYFTLPSLDRELSLSFKRSDSVIEIKIHPVNNLFEEYYDAWIDQNQKKVDQLSNNRIAYGYMKNMGRDELESFIIDMTRELNKKDALIFDLRYNTGGNVHDDVLKFLSQRAYLKWKHREGKLTPQSNFTPNDKPIILLTNEQSLSDAEMTAEGFRALKLGKIVGNETYRWIIFTSGTGLVDGSFMRLPAWGCYGLDGRDLEMNGVKPDIKVINTFEDKMSGKDPQIERAVEEILKMLKK